MTIEWAGDARGYIILCDEPGCRAVSEHNSDSINQAITEATDLDRWDVHSSVERELIDRCDTHKRTTRR